MIEINSRKPIAWEPRGSAGPQPTFSVVPRAKGVLLLSPEGAAINSIQVRGSVDERDNQRAFTLVEACKVLLTRKFAVVIVLPGVLEPTHEVGLELLRSLADEASVLVLTENADTGPATFGGCGTTAAAAVALNGSRPDCLVAVSRGRPRGLVTVNGQPLELSVTQERILLRLLDAPHNRCTIADLIEALPNPSFRNATSTLRVHIHRIRTRLSRQGCGGILVSAGCGYYSLRWPSVALQHD